MEWLQSRLPARRDGAFDVCLCAGDVSDKEEVLLKTLGMLTNRFDEVLFALGNHDVWVPTKYVGVGPSVTTSLDRVDAVRRACDSLRVRTRPLWICGRDGAQDVLVVPLMSWYHEGWDKEPDLPGASAADFKAQWSDFHRCAPASRPSREEKPSSCLYGKRPAAARSQRDPEPRGRGRRTRIPRVVLGFHSMARLSQ
eukprot:4568033-Prymnesium_polylepis.1